MNVLQRFPLIGAALLAAIVVIILTGRGVSTTDAAPQDVVGFDRRISMLEQRFYRLEQSITRLEQYASSQRSTGSSSNREIDQMRQELQRMQLRLNEVECGLRSRRTDSNGEPRAPERGDARPADPCRQNPGLPLRLPSRP